MVLALVYKAAYLSAFSLLCKRLFSILTARLYLMKYPNKPDND